MEDVCLEMEECVTAKEVINYIVQKGQKQALKITLSLAMVGGGKQGKQC